MTRRLVDLHTHSTASDGSASPAELIDAAEKRNLAAVALTDHDTLAGLPEAARQAEKYPELHFVPGIEISAVFEAGTLHILGLGIEATSKPLLRIIDQLRSTREQRNPKIIAKLQNMGLTITMEDVLACVPGSHEPADRIVSRLHIAEALRRNGHIRTITEAFDKYVGKDAPAFVEKELLAPSEVFEAISSAGGASVIAHPVQLQCGNSAQLERIFRQFRSAGLDGIECYHSDHSPELTRLYLDLAKKLDLLITGGSDYHGSGKPHVSMGKPHVPLSVIRPNFAQKWFN